MQGDFQPYRLRTRKDGTGRNPCRLSRGGGLLPYESRDERSYGKTLLALGGEVREGGLFHFRLGGDHGAKFDPSIVVSIFAFTLMDVGLNPLKADSIVKAVSIRLSPGSHRT